jgi:hypothetical protein
MDYWWDGVGSGSCWQAGRSEPLRPPGCGSGAGTARYVAEPSKLTKLYACARYNLATATVPGDCEWYGATGLSRAEVRATLFEAALLTVVLLLTWWRLLRWSGFAVFGVLLVLTGFVLTVLGTLWEASAFAPAGLNVLGVGWVVFGVMLHRRGRPGLGFLTTALGVIALVCAVDRGIWMLPYVPLSPSVWRMALELCWLPTALVVALRGRRKRPKTSRSLRRLPRRRRSGDPLEDFTAVLRL